MIQWQHLAPSLAQISPTDLHVLILGQLPLAQLPLGDALDPGPLEVVGLKRSGLGRSGKRCWTTRSGARPSPR
jgi:hypothetical protein